MTAAPKPQPEQPQKAEEPRRYQVTAPCVLVRVPNGPGGAIRGAWLLQHFYKNAVLPPGTHEDDIERLLKARRPGPAGVGGGKPMIVPFEPASATP